MSVIWSGVTEEGAVVPVQVTDEGKVVAVGDGPQGDYLPITGGTLTGDLTLGTDKITLNATDGSAEFAGNVNSGDYLDTAGGCRLINNGCSILRPAASFSGDTRALTVYNNGITDNDISVAISKGGSATFAGNVTAQRIGDTHYGLLSADGALDLYRNASNYAGIIRLYSDVGSTKDLKIGMYSDGSAEFASHVRVADYLTGTGIRLNDWGEVISRVDGSDGQAAFSAYQGGTTAGNVKARIYNDGSAAFSGDVIIGSRGEKWLIRESNGVAMLVQQSRDAAPMSVSPMIPEKVRDIPSELDLIEMALNEVMEKLRMTPPAGWPVWDGSDNP